MSHSRWQRTAASIGQRIPAPLILVVALILLQLSSGVAKTIMTAENAYGLAFMRVALGGSLLWIVVQPNFMQFSRRQWFDATMLGVVYAVFSIVVYQALARLPLGLVATIGFLGPLAVSLGGANRLLDLLWPTIGFAGVFMLSPAADNVDIPWTSLAYGLGYAAAWAGYILASARAGKSLQGLDGFVVGSVIAAILLIPFGFSQASYFVSTPNLIWLTVLVTLLLTIPLGLEFIALKRIEPKVFGVLLSLEPAIATIVGIVFLSEFLTIKGWIALVAVTAAAIGATLSRQSVHSR